MKITRLYSGNDEQTHFEDFEVPIEENNALGALSELFPAKGIFFREFEDRFSLDWHNTSERTLALILEGEYEIELGDGTLRQFKAGDALLLEDPTGCGHMTRSLGGGRHCHAMILLK